MNPGEFANPGAGPGRPALPVGMRPMKANMQPQKNENIQAIMNHVASVIQNQGPHGGWKATVQVKDRAMHIYQMISSLRLIQPSIGLSQAAQAAMSFESKAFSKANERDDYEKECTEKLLHIKDTRERQAAVAYQTGMMPQTGAVQNQIPVGFPQQMNQNMQNSPVPGQNQMAMGINNAALQQQQHQQRQQQQSQAMLQQQAQQQQRTQQRPANGIPLPDDLNTLSPQDLDHVSRLANEMLSKTSPEDMEKIKLNLSNMTPEQRQYLARKNLDPMTYFFRSQALGQIRRHRRARAEMGRTQNAGMDPNGNMMGDPMMNSQQQRQAFQNMLNLQRNNAFPGNPGQSMEPPNFMGNVENIQGQQADGLRSQEAGQLVVPASSSQMNQAPFPNNNHNNMFPQQMGQNGQANMNGDNVNAQAQFLAQQQHMQGGSNVPQDRMQFQAQAQAQAQARAQAAQKAQMAISGQGGQANPQGQSQLTGQSPGMPMLNQPMAPGQMSPVQVPAQTRPPSRAPNMGQHPGGLQGQAAMQGRPPIPPNIPPHVREQLARMTPEQAQAFILNQQRRAALASNMARNSAQQPGSLQQNQTQPGQPQQMINNQMGNAMMRGSMNVPQDLNPGGLPQGQQLTPQQRQQQQNEMFKLQLLRQQNNGVEMTADQSKQMDRVAFPPSILNMNGTSMQVPKNIKNWGQLKQWAASNPGVSRPNDVSRLMMLQKLHLGQLLSSGTGLVKDPNAPAQQATPFQSTQNQFPNPQGFPVGQQQPPPNMAGMRPISAQDIQIARQKLGPQSANFSDEQIREILHRNRQRQLLQAAQSRAMQMEGNMPPGQQGQPTTQPPFPTAQAVPQPKPQAPQQTQQPADPQSLNAKSQATATAKNAKAVTGKQASKKRPSTDDTADARAMATPQQSQPAMAPGAGTGPSRPGLPFTQEQLSQMTPQQRAQVDAHIWRQQQAQPKILSRAAAEEAWNKNLPPQVMEVYNEISKAAPPAKPLPISPEDKISMTNQLRESLQVLGRLDALVQWYAKVPGQEKNVRNLLAMRIQLMRQFKPSQDWVVNDHFTITNDYLHGAVMFMKRLFQLMLTRIQQQSQRSNASQPPASTAPTAQGNMPALNATNLQQLQAQEEALQRARRASSQSATVPPAPFGAPSPSGVPHAYGPGGLAPENLKLPPPKRRKQSHAGIASSPIQANAAPVAAAKYNKAVADAKSTAAALAGAFKCSVVECQHHYQGFPTQVALDKHVEESHQPEEEEVIDDYLKYYHESISIGLGLNPNDPQVPQVATAGFAPLSTKLSAAASPAKQSIATPVLANMTPMARVTSQLGGKTASPSTSTQLLTPQQSAKGVKSAGKDGKKDAGKFALEDSEQKDPWADCPTSLDALHDTFSNLASKDLPHLGYDPLEDFNINEATPEDDWLALGTLTPPDEVDQATFMDQFYEPWDEESIALAAATIRIPPDIQVKSEGSMGQLEVDWDAVARYDKEGIPIPMT